MKSLLKIFFFLVFFATSCRHEELIVPSTTTGVTTPDGGGVVKGFFLLNEGNMGSNKCTLDYFDYSTGCYTKNIYAERNPNVVKELGDVGNDIQVYKNRLYCVVNCSNFVEVMDLKTAKHIGGVSVPNCRYIAFDGNFAYVSSYAGPVDVDPNSRKGYIAKIDLATLKVVDQCTVGYQPDGLAVVDSKLYVANSGGYRVPNYDNTLSVIDLDSFEEIKQIEVAINLHRVVADDYGHLWVSSRGDGKGVASKTYVVDTATDSVVNEIELPNSNMWLDGDILYLCYNSSWGGGSSESSALYAKIDVVSQSIIDKDFLTYDTDLKIVAPYGLAVNPESKEIFITDAKNYVTPGKVHCFASNGEWKWSATTGDTPAHIAFTKVQLDKPNGGGGDEPQTTTSPYITQVFDYVPAPGQHVNLLPEYEVGDTQKSMNAKVLEAIGGDTRGMITLGSYGGYVTVGFDHTIKNVEGKLDFRILGNAINSSSGSAKGGGCEAGIVMVAVDANKNGLPDDEWFEIEGSAHVDHTAEAWYDAAVANGNDTNFYFADFELTYSAPVAEPDSKDDFATYIPWRDNKGNSSYIPKNNFFKQSYFPQWIDSDELTFAGSRLPQNAIDTSGDGSYFVLYQFDYGYADNALNTDDRSAFDISWAIDNEGNRVKLDGIDFIKIYNGVMQQNGDLGESSTEVCGVVDLHLSGEDIGSNLQL